MAESAQAALTAYAMAFTTDRQPAPDLLGEGEVLAHSWCAPTKRLRLALDTAGKRLHEKEIIIDDLRDEQSFASYRNAVRQ